MTKYPEDLGDLVPDKKFRDEVGGISKMTVFRYDNGQHTPAFWPVRINVNGRAFRGRKSIDRYKSGLLSSAIEQHAARIKLRKARGYRVTELGVE
jgi:hypothetical protein